MGTEHEIKVVNMFEIPSAGAGRTGKRDTFVIYTFDGQGPFTATIPKENFTEAEFKRVAMVEQTERIKWIGKTIKVV